MLKIAFSKSQKSNLPSDLQGIVLTDHQKVFRASWGIINRLVKVSIIAREVRDDRSLWILAYVILRGKVLELSYYYSKQVHNPARLVRGLQNFSNGLVTSLTRHGVLEVGQQKQAKLNEK